MTTTTHSPRRRRARSRGRPASAAEDDVRRALLEAARRLFLKHGFDRVTARQVAAAAGATPAMIHYYFSNKLGLFRAMLEDTIRPVREMLAGALAQGGMAELEVPQLMRMHMHTVAANPWIASFIVTEVLAEKGRFRHTFIRDIASRQLPLVVELLQRGRAAGRLRADLDSHLTALSLLSLCMFPFIARLVVGPVLGLKFEGAELERLVEHTARLFMRGIEQSAAEIGS